jgi:hypothetical protein
MLRTIMRAASVAAACIVLAGCGGSSTPSSTGSSGGGTVGGTQGGDNGGNPPEIIQGVATPSSVAVVTATNAN